jgi:hypothetical protein
VAGTLGVTGITTATGGLNVDTINEITSANGVTIDSVLLKDGGATLTGNLVVDTDTLYVDSATDLVGIGESSPAYTLDIKGNSSTTHGIRLKNSDTAVGGGQVLSQIIFENNDDSGGIEGNYYIKNVSADGFAATNLDIQYDRLGGAVSRLKFVDASGYLASIFNDAGEDVDFRVESDSNTHALFVDASANHVSFFGTSNAAMDGVQGVQIGDTSGTSAGLGMATANHSFLLYIDNSNDLLSLYDSTNNVDRMQLLNDGTFVFNQTGEASADFRIEAYGSQYAFFVDAGNNVIGTGTSTPATYVNTGGLAVKGSTYSDLALVSSSVASGSNSHQIRFYNEAGASYEIARTRVNVGAGQVNRGEYQFAVNNGAGLRRWLDVNYSGDVVFNADGHDSDFRISSDGASHMLFVDAGSNYIGINTSNPVATLAVSNGGASGIEFQPEISTNFNRITNYNRSASVYNELGIDAARIEIRPEGVRRLSVATSGVIVNEDSRNDTDFRVESDSSAHMLFVDAGTDQLLINGSSGSGVVNINKTSHGQAIGLNIVDTESGNGTETLLNLTNNSDQDVQFKVSQVGATTKSVYIGPSTNTQMNFTGAVVGNLNRDLYLDSASLVVNQDSRDYDFRVESDTVFDAFTVDGGTGIVAVNGTAFSVGNHSGGFNQDGTYISNSSGSFMYMERSGVGNAVMYLHRRTTDGNLMEFYQGGVGEGSISVSGTTVSYNGFCGTHDSSGATVSISTPVGTVLSTIDEEHKADHAKVKVSDSVGDKRVYGVLQQYKETTISDDTGQTIPEHVVVASVGIASVRVTGACVGGDLLESNGDGTAKVQSDDIVRSKTLGKVTIGNSDTGVKLVSCVMYCG